MGVGHGNGSRWVRLIPWVDALDRYEQPSRQETERAFLKPDPHGDQVRRPLPGDWN